MSKKYVLVPGRNTEVLTEGFENIFKDFCRTFSDKVDGKQISEVEYGYPTIEMGIDGVAFTNKYVDSSAVSSTRKDVLSGIASLVPIVGLLSKNVESKNC